MMAALAVLGVTGCASIQAVADYGWDEAQAIRRGEAVARRDCLACHGKTSAPDFSAVSHRYSADSLVRELQMISDLGHYAMPVHYIALSDREDLAAYIKSQGRQ